MPRFFFDIDEDGRQWRDSQGLEFPELGEARREAIRILPEIASEEVLNANQHSFVCRVRDESGAALFTAALTLSAAATQAS